MRKFKDVLRLSFGSRLSQRQVARCLSISKTTVRKYLDLAAEAGLSWPLPDDCDDHLLACLLFPAPDSTLPSRFSPPDFASIHQELKRKGVTLALLWEEYASANPGSAYQYSYFCYLYNQWRTHLKVVMRQTHKAGEKLFVDYAGQTVPVIDSSTGDIHQAQIFVAVLGSSNYTYAEATWTQSLVDWISSHVRAFNFFGGVPELIVPDNLKSGVSKACRYEPDLNPTYGELAAHYDVAVLPARPRKPRDKAKVEVGVQIVERWILARLRKESFFSLGELNQRIRALITDLNCRPLKKLSTSRLSQFEALDKPALRPLPAKAYQYCDWKKVRVGFDYHIEIDSHYYSVPYNLVRQQIDIRLTANTVECFHKGRRVASHQRSHIQGGQTTVELHMPQAHRHHQQATPDSLRNWACQVGPATSALVEAFLNRSRHPQQGLRSCLALLSLSRRFGADRLEKASARALAIGSPTRDSVDCILKQGLDQVPLMQEQVDLRLPEHENLRGPSYYTEKDLIH